MRFFLLINKSHRWGHLYCLKLMQITSFLTTRWVSFTCSTENTFSLSISHQHRVAGSLGCTLPVGWPQPTHPTGCLPYCRAGETLGVCPKYGCNVKCVLWGSTAWCQQASLLPAQCWWHWAFTPLFSAVQSTHGCPRESQTRNDVVDCVSGRSFI